MTEPWWSRTRHADRRPFLAARGRIRSACRRKFEAEGFTEVECGLLQVSPGNEAHLHAFSTAFLADGEAQPQPLYLHTSPEFSCKKLLAAGEARIFDFSRVFRNREAGPLHTPEFTMLEWYRANEPWVAVIADAIEIVRVAAGEGERRLSWRDRTCDPFAEPERLTLNEAFERHAGIDLEAVLDDRDLFADRVRSRGMRVGADDAWSDLFSRVLVERIEGELGRGRLTILCEYPSCEAALARPLPSDPRYSERFELYGCGVELANGFGELNDPAEQRRRFDIEMDEKERLYKERYPIDDDFLTALAEMPPASGVALGFDRLVMLVTGARRIDDVLWTPPIRPISG